MHKNAICIAIASGKGGVGKSTLTVNIANVLRKTKTVLAIDCDLGLANLDVLLGETVEYTLQDILYNGIEAEEVYIEIAPNFSLLPSASGTIESIGMDTVAVDILFKKIYRAFEQFQYIFLDLGAGITPVTLSFLQHANEHIIILSPEPSSLLDAYSLIKVMLTRGVTKKIHIITTMVANTQQGIDLYNHLQEIVHKNIAPFLQMIYLGGVVYSEDIIRSVYKQKLFTEEFPNSDCSKCIYHIASALETL